MTTVAVTMVKDEADIVAGTVGNMLEQCDHVIVADNCSTDATRAVLDMLAVDHQNLTVVADDEPGYYQSRKMTDLARRARVEHGADWIVPFDADEIWYSPFTHRIADMLADIGPQWLVAPARLYDHVATGRDPETADPIRRIGWRRDQHAPLDKVACRWRDDLVIGQGNHRADYDASGATIFDHRIVVRHFPYRSVEQFVRKVRNGAAAYRAATEYPANIGTHWRQWGDMLDADGEEAVAEIFRKWYWRANPGEPTTIDGEHQPALKWDPVPV